MAEKILVTGGGGFLGQALIKELLGLGHSICTLNRSNYPELTALGVQCFCGDLADYASVLTAAKDCTLIFHVAAKAGIWGPYRDYYQANVIGTENVLRACRELGISRLIFTSSPSVAFAAKDQEGIDESTPMPKRYLAAYPATKAAAEQLIRAANAPNLATVCLRPHLIWGPGDTHILPRLIDKAKKGRLRLIGAEAKKVDAVYIENAVAAHLCAMERLSSTSIIAGKAYYITNDEPLALEEIINSMLTAAGVAAVHRRIPTPLAYGLGAILEAWYTLFRLSGEPSITRFAVAQLSTAHWYNTQAAQTELGYYPRVTMAEGFKKLQLFLQAKA